jgi:hypothetical protein
VDDDKLVPDRKAREFCGGVSEMTFWRWDRDPSVGLPAPVIINGRKYRRLSQLQNFVHSRVRGTAQAGGPA